MQEWRRDHPEMTSRFLRLLAAGAARYRAEHPEHFMETARALGAWPDKRGNRSLMEEWLRSSGTLTWPDAQIRCLMDERKQVDLVSPDHKIWVEVDGVHHFFPITATPEWQARLAKTQLRDAMLKDEALRRGNVTLIRLSMECFKTCKSKEMKAHWLDLLNQILQSPSPGVWCFGALYESVPWASAGCMILKSPTLSITSCSPAGS
jgi:hypothetical protein